MHGAEGREYKPGEGLRDAQRRGRYAERGLALLLLLAVSPLIALLALGVLLVDGRPVFYRGERLGRGKRPFQIYKLRTLRRGAQAITGAELLGRRQDLTLRGGHFLRETRLDELPQLWNIVRGDMGFVGPRPERPEVYAAKCADIPGYERRFDVPPGLIGISQLFTPHGTAKRYRTLLDNGSLRRRSGFVQDVGVLAFTAWVMLREVVRRLGSGFLQWRVRWAGRFEEKRRQIRVTPGDALVHFGRRTGYLVDMTDHTLRVECEEEPRLEGEFDLLLDIRVRGNDQPAHRTARCRGSVLERRTGAEGSQVVFRFRPCSPRSEYMVHQYFLRGSLAAPRRALPVEPGSQRHAGLAQAPAARAASEASPAVLSPSLPLAQSVVAQRTSSP